VQGIGSSFESQAAYNQAVAAQIQANAAATNQIIAADAEAKKREQTNMIIIFAIVFGVPLLIVLFYLATKK
jgi:F0F1-type ATP synthase membrane subunit c/vacuolar-type H+-ATPase subunit K